MVERPNLRLLTTLAKPLARLFLGCGIGFREFNAALKSAFVEVASEEYGLRGRPTNISRIAAITGLSRREVRRLRDAAIEGCPIKSNIGSPVNVIIHHWQVDPDFCFEPSAPRPLAIEGLHSFQELVRRYCGDVPASALQKELIRSGNAIEDEAGKLILRGRFFMCDELDDALIGSVAFSLSGLLSTINFNISNAKLRPAGEANRKERRFERIAWTNHLQKRDIQRFRTWATEKSLEFIEEIDDQIGECELRGAALNNNEPRTTGVGVYFFELD